ncbi:MAG TPA: HDOD domain-containing protein [Planctomycetota bacterium]
MFESPWPARLDDVVDLPCVPAPAAAALALDDGPIEGLLDVLKAHPPLAANVLRFARTAGLPRGDDATLRASVIRLGFVHVRNLLVGASMLRSFDAFFAGAPYSREAFWRHSLGVGFVAARLGRGAGVSGSIAFLAGQLHDVGKLVLDRHCRAAWSAALRMSRDARLPLHEAEKRMIGGDHAAIGAALLQSWKVPEEVAVPVRDHHKPDACPAPHRRVAMLIQIADYLCVERKVGYGGNEWPELPAPAFLDELGITEPIREAALDGLDRDPLFASLLSI